MAFHTNVIILFTALACTTVHAATLNIADLPSQTADFSMAAPGNIANSIYTGAPVDSTADGTFAWEMTIRSLNPIASRRTLVDMGGGVIGFSVTWTNAGIFAQIQDTTPNPDSKLGGNGSGSTSTLVYPVTAADIGVSREWVVSLDVDATSSTLNLFVDGALIGSVGGVGVTDWAGGDSGGFFTRQGTVLTDAFTSGGGANGPTIAEATASEFRLYGNTFAVPEPSSILLLVLGGPFLARRKRS